MLWLVAHPRITGAELFDLEETTSEIRMRGWVVARVDGVDCAVSYDLTVDHEWITRRIFVRLDSGLTRTLNIDHDEGGTWLVDGMTRPDLHGCFDVDLGISPSTNTLPIRRLMLEIGQKQSLVAAWIRFPDFVVEALPQSYERRSESVYRYRSNSFQADLEVDEAGVVLRYGDDLWRAVDGMRGVR